MTITDGRNPGSQLSPMQTKPSSRRCTTISIDGDVNPFAKAGRTSISTCRRTLQGLLDAQRRDGRFEHVQRMDQMMTTRRYLILNYYRRRN